MNQELKAAVVGIAQGVDVEHNGLKARLRPPTGTDAVRFITDARNLAPSKRLQAFLDKRDADPDIDCPEDLRDALGEYESRTMRFVSTWVGKVLLDEVGDPKDTWKAFLALGGFNGPVPGAMIELVGECLGVPEERLPDVPPLRAAPVSLAQTG